MREDACQRGPVRKGQTSTPKGYLYRISLDVGMASGVEAKARDDAVAWREKV